MKCPKCGREMYEDDAELDLIDEILRVKVTMYCFDCNIEIDWIQRWTLGNMIEERYEIDEDIEG